MGVILTGTKLHRSGRTGGFVRGLIMEYIAYIKAMLNPYDYFEFAAHCAASGVAVLSFSDFAQIVQAEVLDKNRIEIKPPMFVEEGSGVELSITPPNFNMTHAEVTVTKPCCGGGEIR